MPLLFCVAVVELLGDVQDYKFTAQVPIHAVDDTHLSEQLDCLGRRYNILSISKNPA